MEIILKNITEHEIIRLPEAYNLTDGHAYRHWSASEERIIDRTPEFFKGINRQMQFELEREYIELFLSTAKQSVDFQDNKYLLCNSASMGIEIIVNYLRLKRLSLCLVEPCFDNLADICKRHRIPLESFPDDVFGAPEFSDQINTVTSDAVFLVTPNNPTGNILTKDNFDVLVEFCQRNDKILILDCAFRAYVPADQIFDQHDILMKSGIRYIVIEDTGKTWPTLEIKASFLAISDSIYQEIYDIYTDFSLHISPFALKLLSEFVKLSQNESFAYTHEIVKSNRETLYKCIQGTLLTAVEKPYMSVSWLEIREITSFHLKSVLDARGVYVIPGDYFYWSNPELGSHFIRVALVRDPDIFSEAAKLMGEVCRELTTR